MQRFRLFVFWPLFLGLLALACFATYVITQRINTERFEKEAVAVGHARYEMLGDDITWHWRSVGDDKETTSTFTLYEGIHFDPTNGTISEEAL